MNREATAAVVCTRILTLAAAGWEPARIAADVGKAEREVRIVLTRNGQTTARVVSKKSNGLRANWKARVDRLVKEHPAVWRDFVAGRYPLVRAAAVAAGVVEGLNSARRV